jgi:hypothetical protein
MPFGKDDDKEAGKELEVGGPDEIVMILVFLQVEFEWVYLRFSDV